MKCGTTWESEDRNMLVEHQEAAYLALVKFYDNYVTPLDCQVRCWKHGSDDDFFLLGMTITKPNFVAGADPEIFYIVYPMPKQYWNMARVQEITIVPAFDPEDNIKNLLRL
jgi:hypothetical protein